MSVVPQGSSLGCISIRTLFPTAALPPVLHHLQVVPSCPVLLHALQFFLCLSQNPLRIIT